ncbi:hypothetical protein K0M31_005181 [Melipona bicolor]|uniref:Uncharacterized protein n=1 Tax=Melipona bicolor TaxID=60889 RepID=A0AA40FUK9_9HYME|nr:hypothetical protein K0M31_005181 [Melipona bicolor]
MQLVAAAAAAAAAAASSDNRAEFHLTLFNSALKLYKDVERSIAFWISTVRHKIFRTFDEVPFLRVCQRNGSNSDNSQLAVCCQYTNEPVTTCCSDALTRTTGMNVELRLQCLRNLTDLLSRTFKEQFVFPALGHDDIGVNFSQLAEIWQHWLPQEALDTFKTAGYYTIEQRSEKYRIIFLNTNLWLNTADTRMLHRSAGSMIDNAHDPFEQWSWFQKTLETARRKKETNLKAENALEKIHKKDRMNQTLSS